MTQQLNIFIGWSRKPQGLAVAKALKYWIEESFENCAAFVSETDIDVGSRWNDSLVRQLNNSDLAIVCITPDNVQNVGTGGRLAEFCSPWLIFEAGYLARSPARDNIIPFSFGPAQVPDPLRQYQGLQANRAGCVGLIACIGKAVGGKLPATRPHDELFNRFCQNLRVVPDVTQEQRQQMPDVFPANTPPLPPMRGSPKCILVPMLGGVLKEIPTPYPWPDDNPLEGAEKRADMPIEQLEICRLLLAIMARETDNDDIEAVCHRQISSVAEMIADKANQGPPMVAERRSLAARVFGYS